MTPQRGYGIAIGLILGLAIGLFLDNIAIGFAIGIALAAGFGGFLTPRPSKPPAKSDDTPGDSRD